MNRCEKLRDNLYGVELLTGSITPVKEHIAQIFYIVNNTDNSEFIENEALQMITQFGKTSTISAADTANYGRESLTIPHLKFIRQTAKRSLPVSMKARRNLRMN